MGQEIKKTFFLSSTTDLSLLLMLWNDSEISQTEIRDCT